MTSSPESDIDRPLMSRIEISWGEEISEACASSSVQPGFLAALVANESEGKANATRFEPAVYERLLEVAAGKPTPFQAARHRPAHYGEITQRDLRGKTDGTLRLYASSLGLTQVMGYHVIGSTNALSDLWIAPRNLKIALGLLAAFAEEFGLDLGSEFAELFRCWNTGRPDGETSDPRYVENGLRRASLYRELCQSLPAGTDPPARAAGAELPAEASAPAAPHPLAVGQIEEEET